MLKTKILKGSVKKKDNFQLGTTWKPSEKIAEFCVPLGVSLPQVKSDFV